MPDFDSWIARHEIEAERHDCGHPRAVCSDPGKTWFPQRTVCYPTMVRQSVAAKYARIHTHAPYHDGTFSSWSSEPNSEHPFHFEAGVTIWVADTDYTPDDDFLSNNTEKR